jgi:hypothetical protein
MEEVCWRGDIAHEPVGVVHLLHDEVVVERGQVVGVVVAHLQEALGPTRRVLGAHAWRESGE